MPMKRAILVYNPTAGRGPGAHSGEQLLGWLAEAGIKARLVNAKKKKEMRRLSEAHGLIVVAGGDGTIHKVARRVVGRDTTLAVIPLGTANNIARSLGLVGAPRALIAGLGRARKRALDVGIAEGPWGKRAFLEGAGGGLFADVMAALDGGRTRRRRRAESANHKTRFTPYDLHLQPALQFAWSGKRLHVDDKVVSLSGRDGEKRKRVEIVLRVKPAALTFLLPDKPCGAAPSAKSAVGRSPRRRHKIAPARDRGGRVPRSERGQRERGGGASRQ